MDAYSSYEYEEERKARVAAEEKLEKAREKLKAARKEIKELKKQLAEAIVAAEYPM